MHRCKQHAGQDGGVHANKQRQSLVLDFLCVCANSAAEVCKTGYKTKLTNNANLEADALKAATAGCPQTISTTGSITAIESALTTIQALVGKDKDAKTAIGILGKIKTAATDCSHSSNGACVNYATYYGKQHSGFTSIPWVKPLHEAMAYYKLFRVQKQAAEQAKNEIEDLKAAVQAE
ncbi:Trypanosomal VSG domain containing protein, putative [Trypanosoma equiperdum]|uniref:Trypanosomal VSG domain containing protein, putative n=1 Tax=Trypanosoma equiperdum TaxID=5694 RepID=A0A1G4IF80_TRYEQ|nr:Trypanosomal VSG domain containing protein, putative [Trypanosoma equiperdum]